MNKQQTISAFGALCLGLALATGAAAQTTQIGVAAAVVPGTTAQPPQGSTRNMAIGEQLVQRERVVTDAGGKAQILFIDHSTLSIGQNAIVVLDEFVFSAASNEGRLVANVTRGVMRYVGGKISKAGNVEFQTPTGSVGVRGGIVLIDSRNPTETVVMFVYGDHIRVTQRDGTETILRRQGFALKVPLSGRPQTFRPSSDQMSAWAAELEGSLPGTRSAAGTNNATLLGSGVPQIGSEVIPGDGQTAPNVGLLGDRANGVHGLPNQPAPAKPQTPYYSGGFSPSP